MAKATFTIIRQCEECGSMFEAQKRTTRFCSHRCNQRNYKLRKKLERKKEVEAETFKQQRLKPKVKALNLEVIKQKEFLTVKEVAALFGCSKRTVYRMIDGNQLHAVNLSQKLTRIRRKDIEQLFNRPKQIEPPKELKKDDCYRMNEITEKYKVSRNTIYNYQRKHNIPKLRIEGKTYYSKFHIDNLFRQ